MMKTQKFLSAAMIVVLTATFAIAKKGGTNILHYMVKTTMLANEVYDADATARLDLKVRQQGHADRQSLRIRLANLDPAATYTLYALLSGESNATQVAEFTTDESGRADLDYVARGNGKSQGKGHSALPAALNPLIDVLALSVSNSNLNEVLAADFENARVLQYLVKRTLDNDGVEPDAFGVLRLKANHNTQRFSIHASGLTTNTDYLLVINDAVLATHTADAGGKLRIDSLPGGAPSVLDIVTVAVANGASNNVLSTTLD